MLQERPFLQKEIDGEFDKVTKKVFNGEIGDHYIAVVVHRVETWHWSQDHSHVDVYNGTELIKSFTTLSDVGEKGANSYAVKFMKQQGLLN